MELIVKILGNEVERCIFCRSDLISGVLVQDVSSLRVFLKLWKWLIEVNSSLLVEQRLILWLVDHILNDRDFLANSAKSVACALDAARQTGPLIFVVGKRDFLWPGPFSLPPESLLVGRGASRH